MKICYPSSDTNHEGEEYLEQSTTSSNDESLDDEYSNTLNVGEDMAMEKMADAHKVSNKMQQLIKMNPTTNFWANLFKTIVNNQLDMD